MSCKICSNETKELYDPQLTIKYDVCPQCNFIYKQAKHHVSHDREKIEYDSHNNSFESTGYVQMFERFIQDFITPLQLSGVGLEFGSGPGPVLKALLEREGFTMYDYDYFYNPNQDYKTRIYDFITTTEVLEHLTNPLEELRHLTTLLKPKGYLIVMTQFNVFDEQDFLTWWYRRDVTHISFFSIRTFDYLAVELDLTIVKHNHKNVIIFQK